MLINKFDQVKFWLRWSVNTQIYNQGEKLENSAYINPREKQRGISKQGQLHLKSAMRL